MLDKIKSAYEKLKTNVVETVLWAESELNGKTGKEKKAAVVRKLDGLIKLPVYLEWADDLVLAWLVDLACEKLNWLSDWNFKNLEVEAEKVAAVLAVPIPALDSAAKKSAATPQQTVDERLAELYEKYGIKAEEAESTAVQTPAAKPVEPVKPEPIPSPKTDDRWDRSIEFTLNWEGGFVDHPLDRGGPTNRGITLAALKTAYAQGIVKHCDVRALSLAEAKAIYKANYWDKWGWGALPWPVCLCLLDITVNHGGGGMAFIVQRACNALGSKLDIDGKYGPKTKAALCTLGPTKPEALAEQLCAWRKDYYERIIRNNPSQEAFRKGWFNRLRALAHKAGVKSPV